MTQYPEARLFGCDHSPVGISRATKDYGNLAQFFQCDIEDLKGSWDVIFCSNVLEHFEQYLEITEYLMQFCRTLYVMTPYQELRNGMPLKPEAGEFHVATFGRNTFSELARRTGADVKTYVFRAPGAWGPNWTEYQLRRAQFRRFVRNLIRSPKLPAVENARQIVFEITRRER